MKYEFVNPALSASFMITDDAKKDAGAIKRHDGMIQLLWNRGHGSEHVHVDDLNIELKSNQITTVTYYHHLGFKEARAPISSIAFNRGFYCISDHDYEIGCNGILFFGSQELPVITIPPDQLKKFNMLWEVILEEFRTRDNIQGEMLQMLLKRFIIICTRLAKEQLSLRALNDSQIETVRKFNFLVDMHFREKKKVSAYAKLLHKSPKTLSNIFNAYSEKSPHRIIQERVVLEAKRLIHFTDKQTQEIAYDLGFDDPAHFSRYFKKVTNLSPTAYRETQVLGV